MSVISGRGPLIITCRSCGVRIRMVPMQSGKWMPVEVEPVSSIAGQTLVINGKVERNLQPGIMGYSPHWEICEHARKK